MSVFDREYFGLIGSCSFIGIGLLMAADVRLDFLVRGRRVGMSEVVKDADESVELDGCGRFECKLDALLFWRLAASSCFGGSTAGVSEPSASASANFPTTQSKLSETPSDVK